MNLSPFHAALFLILSVLAAVPARYTLGLPVVVPTRKECLSGAERDSLVLAHIYADGLVRINGEDLRNLFLKRRLRQIFSTRAQRLLFVKAEPDTAFSTVALIIDIAKTEADMVALVTPSQPWSPAACFYLTITSGFVASHSRCADRRREAGSSLALSIKPASFL